MTRYSTQEAYCRYWLFSKSTGGSGWAVRQRPAGDDSTLLLPFLGQAPSLRACLQSMQSMPAHCTAGVAGGVAGGGVPPDRAAAMIEWARQRSKSPRGRRQRRQATILARDMLALLGGVRSCSLLDAEHGAYASDADALIAFLQERERSSGRTVRTPRGFQSVQTVSGVDRLPLNATLSKLCWWPGCGGGALHVTGARYYVCRKH